MKIVMFTGFLGSGKTTLALDFARYLGETGKKTAFIINEAGEIALDSQLAREKNYRVEEVFSGCICCQVSGDFSKALDSIIEDEKPQRVIIEPSGVADPANLLLILEKKGYADIPVINVVDIPRFILLYNGIPLIKNSLLSATAVIINKLDQMKDKSELQEARTAITTQNSGVKIFTVSAKEGIPDSLWQEVASW